MFQTKGGILPCSTSNLKRHQQWYRTITEWPVGVAAGMLCGTDVFSEDFLKEDEEKGGRSLGLYCIAGYSIIKGQKRRQQEARTGRRRKSKAGRREKRADYRGAG